MREHFACANMQPRERGSGAKRLAAEGCQIPCTIFLSTKPTQKGLAFLFFRGEKNVFRVSESFAEDSAEKLSSTTEYHGKYLVLPLGCLL